MRLKIGTYNIAHGRGTALSNWGGGSTEKRIARLQKIADVIKNLDVVVLNEVDFAAPWTLWDQNQEYILKNLAGFPHSTSMSNNSLVWYAGNVILSKFPLIDREIIELPQQSKLLASSGFRKDALASTVVTPEGPLKLVAIHFDWHFFSNVRNPSAEIVLGYACKQNLPVVLAGDFNTTPTGFPGCRDDNPTALDLFKNSGLFLRHLETNPMKTDMTFHSKFPRFVIDWILIPRDWKFLDYKVLDVTLSDHRPVVAEVSSQ